MRMKPLIFAILAIVLTCVSLLLDNVSALRYDYIFAIIFICNIWSALCLIPLIRLGGWWNYVSIIVTIVILYTILDIYLRWFFHVNVFYIFRIT